MITVHVFNARRDTHDVFTTESPSTALTLIAAYQDSEPMATFLVSIDGQPPERRSAFGAVIATRNSNARRLRAAAFN